MNLNGYFLPQIRNKIKRAFNFYDGDGNLEYVLKLFKSYKENYELLEGKKGKMDSGWFFYWKAKSKTKK